MRFLFAVVMALGMAVEASAAVKICRSGGLDVYADNTGYYPVWEAFQKCIDDTTVTRIDLQPGVYLVDAPIVVWRAFRIGTAGLASDTRNCQQLPAGWCATFKASASTTACINDSAYCDPEKQKVVSGGMLQGIGARGVVFDHLILDGNRAARIGTESYNKCIQPNGNVFGFNARFSQCDGTSTADRCQFTYSYTKNAVCGTGLVWDGNYGRIQGNAASGNGDTQGRWADGLTILRNNYGIINDNHVWNNTDVGLIVGGAYQSQIQSNWIEQNGVYAFAGMMLGNFKETGGAGTSGDFRGATIRYNTINCYGFNCGIGLNLGPDPWSPVGVDYANIFGGTITQNNINGARVLINFGGAGTATHPTTVTNNTLTNPPTYSIPLRPGSPCYATPHVLQNLPNNYSTGSCGNFANADPLATSMNCFKACWQ